MDFFYFFIVYPKSVAGIGYGTPGSYAMSHNVKTFKRVCEIEILQDFMICELS